MKKKILFPIAALGMVAASLTFNFNADSKKVSAVELSDLVQTADAASYWTQDCTDPFISDASKSKPTWNNVQIADVPVDGDDANDKPYCTFGGWTTCNNSYELDQTLNVYDSEGNQVYDSEGRAVTTTVKQNVKTYWVGNQYVVDVNDPYYEEYASGNDPEFGGDWYLFGNPGENPLD